MPEDGHRYELLDGTLIVTPVPTVTHQICVGSLLVLLYEAKLPEQKVLPARLDVRLSRSTVFEPPTGNASSGP